MKRLWVDANVILRFLTGEPETMARQVLQLMARAERGEVVLFISPLVLAEVIWVLKSFYKYSMGEIRGTILPLISADGIEVADRDLTVRAIELASDRNVDFINAYLAVHAAQSKEAVCTLDESDFNRLPVAWVLPE